MLRPNYRPWKPFNMLQTTIPTPVVPTVIRIINNAHTKQTEDTTHPKSNYSANLSSNQPEGTNTLGDQHYSTYIPTNITPRQEKPASV